MWTKLGRVFYVDGSNSSYPTPAVIDGKLKIFFASRDEKGTSRVFHFDMDDAAPCQQPDLCPGPRGTFDCDGVAPRCIVGNFLYLIGWNKCQSFPYTLSIGLAKFEDGEWRKIGQVLGRNRHDPYFCTSPCVMEDEGMYRMWYCSCTDWVENEPKYLIKYAESPNGIDWTPTGKICIGYEAGGAIGWPMVTKENGTYSMIYSYRGEANDRTGSQSYRLGEATSKDGLHWDLLPSSPLEPSETGWDSEMVCYSSVIGNKMFYNGNGFGLSGIGLAIK